MTMANKSYINSAGRKVLEYITPDKIRLDLPFVMTHDKFLIKNMPYLKLEQRTAGNDIAAIKLLNFQDYEGVIFLNIEDLKSNRCYNLSWNMEVDGDDWWLWSLCDYETLSSI